MNKSKLSIKRYALKNTELITNAAGVVTDNVSTLYNLNCDSSMQRTGADNPFYKQTISKKESAINALTVTAIRRKFSRGKTFKSFQYDSAGRRHDYSCEWHGLSDSLEPLIPIAMVQEASGLAGGKIMGQIRSRMESLNGLTFIAELRELIDQIHHPAKSLRSMLNAQIAKDRSLRTKHAVAKRDLRIAQSQRTYDSLQRKQKIDRINKRKAEVESVSKAFASSWLEFSFGAAPAMDDISKIAESVTRLDLSVRLTQLQARGRVEKQKSTTYSNGMGGNSYSFKWDVSTEFIAEAQYLTWIKEECTLDKEPFHRIADYLGLNWANLIPAIYEASPWSFFLDYFGNIGAVLTAECTDLSSVAFSCLTTRTHSIVRVRSGVLVEPVTPYAHGVLSEVQPGSYQFNRKVVQRSQAALTYPKLAFKLPSRNTQFLNLAALARLLT